MAGLSLWDIGACCCGCACGPCTLPTTNLTLTIANAGSNVATTLTYGLSGPFGSFACQWTSACTLVSGTIIPTLSTDWIFQLYCVTSSCLVLAGQPYSDPCNTPQVGNPPYGDWPLNCCGASCSGGTNVWDLISFTCSPLSLLFQHSVGTHYTLTVTP
jgi:hypothetical protein